MFLKIIKNLFLSEKRFLILKNVTAIAAMKAISLSSSSV